MMHIIESLYQTYPQLKKLIRYGVIGVTTNGISFGVYIYLTDYMGMSPEITVTILYVVTAGASYVLNRRVTFAYQGSWLWSVSRYIIMHIGGYVLNIVMLYICVNIYNMPHQYVELAATFVSAIYLYLISNWFVFRTRTSHTVT